VKTTDAQFTSVQKTTTTTWTVLPPPQFSLAILELKIYEATQRKKLIEKVMGEFQQVFADYQKHLVAAVNRRQNIVTNINNIDKNIPVGPGSIESHWLAKLTAQKNKWLSLILGTDTDRSTFITNLETEILVLKNLRSQRRTSPLLQNLYIKMREIHAYTDEFKYLTKEIEIRRADLNKNKIRLDNCQVLFNKEHGSLTQQIADLEESAAMIYQDQENRSYNQCPQSVRKGTKKERLLVM
jgi:hypothetical protein